ncbi:dynactin subunit 3 [Polypterus senegalus]|uniref:dynactin subunit 3 n=1 Tax=Polypterus senegalus TaxID=55291 RepID=UPI001966607D|nr:dynactin subunit 3 [Polypterus senegalus]
MEAMVMLDGLEERLERLEKRLDVDKNVHTGKPVKCVDALVRIQTSLSAMANKRERVKTLHKKIDDLMKYLDPQFTERITVPDAVRLECVIAEEEFIMSQASLLEHMSSLVPLLDSTYIKVVPEHATKLQSLSQIHIQQQDQCETLTDGTKKLFEDYNKMMFLLSKQFSQWDETLRKLEATAKQDKHATE